MDFMVGGKRNDSGYFDEITHYTGRMVMSRHQIKDCQNQALLVMEQVKFATITMAHFQNPESSVACMDGRSHTIKRTP